jgi:hypothetical protein
MRTTRALSGSQETGVHGWTPVSWLNEPAAAETARFEAALKFIFSSAMNSEARERLLTVFRERQGIGRAGH